MSLITTRERERKLDALRKRVNAVGFPAAIVFPRGMINGSLTHRIPRAEELDRVTNEVLEIALKKEIDPEKLIVEPSPGLTVKAC
jgi:hypothetical protein